MVGVPSLHHIDLVQVHGGVVVLVPPRHIIFGGAGVLPAVVVENNLPEEVIPTIVHLVDLVMAGNARRVVEVRHVAVGIACGGLERGVEKAVALVVLLLGAVHHAPHGQPSRPHVGVLQRARPVERDVLQQLEDIGQARLLL